MYVCLYVCCFEALQCLLQRLLATQMMWPLGPPKVDVEHAWHELLFEACCKEVGIFACQAFKQGHWALGMPIALPQPR